MVQNYQNGPKIYIRIVKKSQQILYIYYVYIYKKKPQNGVISGQKRRKKRLKKAQEMRERCYMV